MWCDGIQKGKLPKGGLAVVYDKNPMETTGYAAALADAMKEPVWLVEFYHDDSDPPGEWWGDGWWGDGAMADGWWVMGSGL